MKNIEIETIFLLVLSFFTILIINQFRDGLSKTFHLVDDPDNIRKFHSKSVPLLGGIMIFLHFLLVLTLNPFYLAQASHPKSLKPINKYL